MFSHSSVKSSADLFMSGSLLSLGKLGNSFSVLQLLELQSCSFNRGGAVPLVRFIWTILDCVLNKLIWINIFVSPWPMYDLSWLVLTIILTNTVTPILWRNALTTFTPHFPIVTRTRDFIRVVSTIIISIANLQFIKPFSYWKSHLTRQWSDDTAYKIKITQPGGRQVPSAHSAFKPE